MIYFSPLTAIVIACELLAPQTTLVPHTTLKPLLVLVPHTTELPKQPTGRWYWYPTPPKFPTYGMDANP